MGAFLTIRKRTEDSSRAEAAKTSNGARSDLHFVLGGPAEVCQDSLVPVALYGVALILATLLLGVNRNGSKRSQSGS